MRLGASEMGRGLAPIDLRRFASSVPGAPRAEEGRLASRFGGDDLTRRSLASVGAAGLVALPMLLTASSLMNAPVAAPAAIALGYLAAAHSLALDERRRAAAWSLAVHCGLVLWTALYVLAATGPLSWGALAALVLAPAFAAAPALARRLLTPAPNRRTAAAFQDAACLDRHAPDEAVLFVDRRGNVLAATQAGARFLGLHSGHEELAGRVGVSRFFSLADRPLLLDAIARRQAGEPPAELKLFADAQRGGSRHVAALLGDGRNASITISLRSIEAVEPSPAPPAQRADVATIASAQATTREQPKTLACDPREAITFAIARAGKRTQAKRIRLVRDSGTEVMAGCERQLCRRIVALLLDSAVDASPPEAEIQVEARGLRGAVLLRVTFADEGGWPAAVERLRDALAVTGVAELVDQAGGTILVAGAGRGAGVSVRLASAGPGSAGCRAIHAGAA